MYIDFADYSTIPSELEENIIDAFTSMPQNVVSEIKARSVEGDLDVCCAIEKYLKQPKAQWLYERLNGIMSQYEIICYHATKVLNKSSILNEGLKVNEIESYKKEYNLSSRNVALERMLLERRFLINSPIQKEVAVPVEVKVKEEKKNSILKKSINKSFDDMAD